jgi:hypothetical protein
MSESPQEDALIEAMHKCEIMTVVDHLVAYLGSVALSAVRSGEDPTDVFATVQEGLRISIDYSLSQLQPEWYIKAGLIELELSLDNVQ